MWEKAYEIATGALQKPAAHGILNGKVYTPKKSYETITSLAAIFSDSISPTKDYMHVDMPESRSEELLSMQTFTFIKCGYPLYAYYLPLSLEKAHDISYTANLYATKNIEYPVLIDPYTSEIFKLDNPQATEGIYKYPGLIVKDYPIIVTDKRAFKITDNQ